VARSFDFTGVANNLNDNIVFIFDLGTAGDGSVQLIILMMYHNQQLQ
jgi:hypothetical protein